MNYCSKCGKLFEQGDKFCSECSNPLEVSVDQATEGQEILSKEPDNYAQDSEEEVTHLLIENNNNKKPIAKSKKKIIIAISSLIIIILVAVFFIKLGIFASNPETDLSLIYVKDHKELHYLDEKYGKSLLLTSSIVDSDDSSTREYICNVLMSIGGVSEKSPDNKKIAYLSSIEANTYIGDLYIQDNTEKENSDGEDDLKIKISSKVQEFEFLDDNQVLYIKASVDDSGIMSGSFFLYNVSENSSTKIEDDVDWFSLAAGSKNVLMFRNTSKDEYLSCYDLYLKSLDEEGEKTKIDSEIVKINAYKPDFTEFIYSKVSEKDSSDYDIYRYSADTGKKEVGSNVYSVVSAEADGAIYYYKDYDEIVPLEQLVNDDMAASDARLSKPDTDNFRISYREGNISGWYVDYPAYLAACQKYENKLARDKIRSYLSDKTVTVNKTDLYCLSIENKETKIDTDVDKVVTIDSENGRLIYSKKDRKLATKLNMSQLKSIYDIPNYSDGNTYSYYVYDLGNKPVQLFANKTKDEDVKVNSDWSKIYYLYKQGTKENGIVYEFTLKNKVIKDKKEIKAGVGAYEVEDDDSILLLTDQKDYVGELYLIKDEKENLLGNGVIFSSVLYLGSNDVYFVKNYDKKVENGEFTHYTDGSEKVLEKNVYDYLYLDRDLIYIYKDYNSSRMVWDIYKYEDGEKLKSIDYDVSNVQSTNQEYAWQLLP